MKTKIYALTAIAACIGLLLTGFPTGAGQLETKVILSFSGVVQQPPTETYTYIISILGSNYQMTDGITRQIDYQSTNATQVINNAIGNLTKGSGSILFSSGTYNLNGSITATDLNNTTLAFDNDASLYIENGMDAPAISLYNPNNCLINGVTIDGNAANNPIDSHYEHGIFIAGGSNNCVDGANIYNVRKFGYYVESWATPAINDGIINSKITNCGWNGITLGADGEVSLYSINNYIAYCGDVGITNYGIGDIVTGNTIYKMNSTAGSCNSQWGIGVEGGGNDTINGNQISYCKQGIVDEGTSDTISQNNIQSTINTAAWMTGQNSIFSNNQIYSWDSANTWQPALILQGNYMNVLRNVFNCSNPHAEGIDIFSCNNQISNNYIFTGNSTNGNTFGIQVESGANGNNISQNTISGGHVGYGAGINVVSGVESTTLSDNNLAGCLTYPITDSGTYTVTNAITLVATVGATVMGGQVLFTNSTGNYYLANAVSSTTMNVVAMAAQNGTSTNTCEVLIQGYFTNPIWSWTVGASLYVSNSTDGGLTQTVPTTSGNIDQYVGYAVSATEIYFAPDT